MFLRKMSAPTIGLLCVTFLLACHASESQNLSAVSPNSVYAGNQLDVIVAGVGTNWDANSPPTLDFGPDITVDQVTVVNRASLSVRLTIAPTGAIGTRDVVVSSAGQAAITLRSAFTVESPLGLTISGDLAQGSMAFLTLRNRDYARPFDTAAVKVYADDVGQLLNLNFTMPTGVGDCKTLGLCALGAGPYSVTTTLFIDPTAETGTRLIELLSGPAGNVVHYPAPVEIAPRTPIEVDPQADMQMEMKRPFESQLFVIRPTKRNSIHRLRLVPIGNHPDLFMAILTPEGSFAKAESFATLDGFVRNDTDPFQVVVWDTSGNVNYKYDLIHNEVFGKPAAEQEPNDTIDNSNTIGEFPAVLNGGLTNSKDVDIFRFEVNESQVGKRLRMFAFRSINCEVSVNYKKVVGGQEKELGLGGSYDTSLADVVTDAFPQVGTYYVKVRFANDVIFSDFDPIYFFYAAIENAGSL